MSTSSRAAPVFALAALMLLSSCGAQSQDEAVASSSSTSSLAAFATSTATAPSKKTVASTPSASLSATDSAVENSAQPVTEELPPVTEELPPTQDTETSAVDQPAPAPVQQENVPMPAPQVEPAVEQAPITETRPEPVPLTGTLLTSGAGAQTLGTYSGSGNITLTINRDPNSAAPNIPTYISMICDGVSLRGGAVNATSTEGQSTITVAYAGSNCILSASAAQPSAKWAGTYNGVYVAVGAPVATNGVGTPTLINAGWVSTAVAGTNSFILPTPAGFRGAVDMKLTACSSQGAPVMQPLSMLVAV